MTLYSDANRLASCFFLRLRSSRRSCALVLAVFGSIAGLSPLPAQAALDTDSGRVSPVFTPLPIPSSRPVSDSSWPAAAGADIVPLSGSWRFRLVRGQTIDGVYVSTPELSKIVAASSTSGGDGYWSGAPSNAFDDDIGTLWTPAKGASLPQWLRIDLGRPRSVAGVRLFWDKRDLTQRYRIEGSLDGAEWSILSDQTSDTARYAAGGRILFPSAATARYVRLFITGAAMPPPSKPADKQASQAPQAQVAEFRVMVEQDGQMRPWLPDESDDGFQQPSYSDRRWDVVSLPSNWELAGYSRPTYNDYDDAAGEYRRAVFVPKSFAGKQVVWRFDGVFDGADIYVNGVKAGYHESGYTAFDVDLTGLIRPGQVNELAVRACKRTSSIDCDTGDFEALGGIYRDSFLYAVPPAHLADLTARTRIGRDHADAALDVALAVKNPPDSGAEVEATLYDSTGRRVAASAATRVRGGAAELRITLQHPRLWSAETPALYTLVATLRDQRGKALESVQQRVGFRQIEIGSGNVLLWNGAPIKLAGVCRHEIWPTRGAALNDAVWRRDITLLKAANVNAIRTSHYNHASRFLDLCDESGFYILDEVPYCWLNEKTYDLGYRPAMIQRARETYARDKNRPSVLAWSCGNENPAGSNTAAVAEFMHRHDPTRPAFSSQQSPPFPGQSFNDRHYPGPSAIGPLAKLAARTAPAILTEQPHLFSAGPSLAYDPGLHDFWGVALARSWKLIERAPDIAGSFVWEWQNQPIVSSWSDSAPSHRGSRTVWFENNKGVVDGYRAPKPEWWAVKMVYSPVQIDSNPLPRGTARIAVRNRYSFTDLSQLTCRLQAERNGSSLRSGILPVRCAPGGQTLLRLPVPGQATSMRLEFRRKYSAPGISAGDLVCAAELPVAGASGPEPPHAALAGVVSGPLTARDAGGFVTISNSREAARFDRASGDLVKWTLDGRAVLSAGPTMFLGETHPVVSQYGQDTSGYLGAGLSVRYGDPRLDFAGAPDGSVHVTVTRQIQNAQNQQLALATATYTVKPDARIAVHWEVRDWSGAETQAWEIGMRLRIAPTLTHMAWLRRAQFADYPAKASGAPQGVCALGDTSFRASKRNLEWMAVTGASGHGIALMSDGGGDPLIGRLQPQPGQATVLYASRQEAVAAELSDAWVADCGITLRRGRELSGGFVLAAL